MFWLVSWMLGSVAWAGQCDVTQLKKDLKEASPVAVPRVFLKLKECDAAAAKEVATDAMKRTLAGDDGNKAALAALTVGADGAVQNWIDAMEPDHRSRTVGWLGEQCAEHEAVQKFFVKAQETKQAEFFEQRWHRGLASCRTPAIAKLLTEALDASYENSRDRAAFFGVLEVYSRNLGATAIPRLTELARSMDNPKEVKLVVSAYADAANVGSVGGLNAETAKKAAKAIEELGPELPQDAIEAARDTLRALDKGDLANRFAKYRWADRLVDGQYTYAVVAKEIVTCKNGKKQGFLHYGEIKESGSIWPEDLKPKLDALLTERWSLDAARKCKGTADVETAMVDEPLSGDASEWMEPHREGFTKQTKGFSKIEEIDEGPLTI